MAKIVHFISLISIFVVLIYASSAKSIELSGSFSNTREKIIRDNSYIVFQFEVDKSDELRLTIESDADTFLSLLSPNGILLQDDDSGGDNNPAIKVSSPERGTWKAIGRKYYSSNDKTDIEAAFTIILSGGAELKLVEPGSEGTKNLRELVKDFENESEKAKRIKDQELRQARIESLANLLSLPTLRNDLSKDIKDGLFAAQREQERMVGKIEQTNKRAQDLEVALNSIVDSKIRNSIMNTVESEISSLRRAVAEASKRLLSAKLRETALADATKQISELGKLYDEIDSANEELLAPTSETNATELRSVIRTKRDLARYLARELAEKLIDSELARKLRLGRLQRNLFSDRGYLWDPLEEDIIGVGQVTAGSDTTRTSKSSKIEDIKIDVDTEWFDKSAWLPNLFPWPPKAASSQIVFDKDYVEKLFGISQKLEDLDKNIRNVLGIHGYTRLSYFGVPSGFSLVTQLEQIDFDGIALTGPNRWSTSVVQMDRFSLYSYLEALFTQPAGYYRVMIFLITNKPFPTVAEKLDFQTVEQWSREGLNHLPDPIGKIVFSDDYRLTVLIYEFEKISETKFPRTLWPGRYTADIHLRRAAIIP